MTMQRISTLIFSICAVIVPNLLKAHISPSQLQVNLGILPVDVYNNTLNNGNPPVIPNSICPATSTVRSCFNSYLANYASQGVTGVRFFFALGDGYWSATYPPTTNSYHSSYSTPFSSTGVVSATWVSNLANFLADLKAHGIKNIAPASVMSDYWAGWNEGNNGTFATWDTSASYRTPSGVTCPAQMKGTESLWFFPWLPFGLAPGSRYGSGYPTVAPDQYTAANPSNLAYDCSPANPIAMPDAGRHWHAKRPI